MGVRVVMITGDARQVADAVGRRPRHRRGVRRGAPRGQGRQGRRAPGARPDGRHGRRRRQRRPRARPRRRRHRHRRRHRRRHRVRRPHPRQLRPPRRRRHHPALPGHLPQDASRTSWWAAGYNVVAIPLAAGALAWAGFTLPPAVGAVLMSAVHHRRRPQRPAPAPPRPQREASCQQSDRRRSWSAPERACSSCRRTSVAGPGRCPSPTTSDTSCSTPWSTRATAGAYWQRAVPGTSGRPCTAPTTSELPGARRLGHRPSVPVNGWNAASTRCSGSHPATPTSRASGTPGPYRRACSAARTAVTRGTRSTGGTTTRCGRPGRSTPTRGHPTGRCSTRSSSTRETR
jgi:hypothetical protein